MSGAKVTRLVEDNNMMLLLTAMRIFKQELRLAARCTNSEMHKQRDAQTARCTNSEMHKQRDAQTARCTNSVHN